MRTRTTWLVTLRREQAETRAAAYAKLTLEEKLAKAGKRETAKLLARAAIPNPN